MKHCPECDSGLTPVKGYPEELECPIHGSVDALAKEDPYQIVIEHKGEEIKTAEVLKWRQRARQAEKEIESLENRVTILLNEIDFYAKARNPYHGCRCVLQLTKEMRNE